MSDEEVLQTLLDANPEDFQTRLVFADWLEERADPRAEGYRALGVLGKRPDKEDHQGPSCPYWTWRNEMPGFAHLELPPDWFDLLDVPGKSERFAPDWTNRTDATRRELEDSAALAFAKLSPERRAELLAEKSEAKK